MTIIICICMYMLESKTHTHTYLCLSVCVTFLYSTHIYVLYILSVLPFNEVFYRIFTLYDIYILYSIDIKKGNFYIT